MNDNLIRTGLRIRISAVIMVSELVAYLESYIINVSDYLSSGRIESHVARQKATDSEFLFMNVFFGHCDDERYLRAGNGR